MTTVKMKYRTYVPYGWIAVEFCDLKFFGENEKNVSGTYSKLVSSVRLFQSESMKTLLSNDENCISPEDLETRMAAFKKSFGRKKRPEIMAISAAGRVGISELISAIEKKFLTIEKAENNE